MSLDDDRRADGGGFGGEKVAGLDAHSRKTGSIIAQTPSFSAVSYSRPSQCMLFMRRFEHNA